MSLREFPGLLKQLPQHRPWMITISMIAVAVVLASCGFGSYLLLKDESLPGEATATTAPTVERRDITSRETDGFPLTVADVIPTNGEIASVANPGGEAYKIMGEPQSGDDCRAAANREVQRLVGEVNCTQFIRASFYASDPLYFITVGVLNLPDMTTANDFALNVGELAPLKDQGTLTGYVTDQEINGALSKAEPSLLLTVRGHFLLYVVIVHRNGTPMSEADQAGEDAIQYDILTTYLDTVMTTWSTIDPSTRPPVEPSVDPSATASA
jgi:hypothetical protein